LNPKQSEVPSLIGEVGHAQRKNVIIHAAKRALDCNEKQTHTCEGRGATGSSFRGGGIFMNFHSMMSSCLFNCGTTISLFCKRSQTKFSSQHS